MPPLAGEQCPPCDSTDSLNELADFIRRHQPLFVLTGAGCSTESGIPDYRDASGAWKHQPPVQYQDFVRSETVRQRYWARSMLGWPRFAQAQPNSAHEALARLEAAGFVGQLVTQNVDGLHQQAGSRRVIDLHGRLDAVECLNCGSRTSRIDLQELLEQRNPAFRQRAAAAAPDGDAGLEDADFSQFQAPACGQCGGVLKPGVVFFGESVPRSRVNLACQRLAASEALLVVGSSLMVFSGYRFCRSAAEQGKPIAAVNLGRTRADELLALKVAVPCGQALSALTKRLGL